MVTIIGNVKPEDDYTHPLGPEENFNESVYFNFFDREKQMGGFLRIGNRANEGHAEMTVIVYQPGGSALFNYKRPRITSNDGWDAGGLKVDVLVPGVERRDQRVIAAPERHRLKVGGEDGGHRGAEAPRSKDAGFLHWGRHSTSAL